MLPTYRLYEANNTIRREVAMHFAFMADLSYRVRGGHDDDVARNIGFLSIERFFRTDAQSGLEMIVCGDNFGVQVGIAGTQTLSQWFGYVLQSGISPIEHCQGRTFLAFELWANALLSVLQGILTLGPPIILCGHSLGGAMSILLAEKLFAIGYNVRVAYTYGCPRIGDELFCTTGSRRIHNIVGESDAVTNSPPALLSTGVRLPLLYSALPSLFRPGQDWELADTNNFAQDAVRQMLRTISLGVDPFTAYDTARFHVNAQYLGLMWRRLSFEQRQSLSDWWSVATNTWNMTLTPK
jgi:Lipase (class 3)